MFPIRPAEAQIALETWTRENRGVDNFDQPTRVTREEFEGLFSLLQAAKQLEGLGGLPFAIVSVEIEESKAGVGSGYSFDLGGAVEIEEPKLDMRTGAARVRLSKPVIHPLLAARSEMLEMDSDSDFSVT